MNVAQLEVTAANQSRTVPIRGKLTIGRHPGNMLVLDDTQASRNHCVIEQAGQDYILRDLGSRNGTRVNGALVASHVLSPGDVITIGQTQMRFVVPGSQPGGAVELDYLSPEDVVEVHDEHDGLGAGIGFGGLKLHEDYEKGLEQLADALPDKAFGEWDIELVNARGQTVHQASGTPRGRDAPRREAVDLFRLLLLICFRSRATDIHIEPREDVHQCRIRVDGNMVDVARLPNAIGVKLTTLVKVLSDIDIAQRNTIQEGHFVARAPSPRGGRRRVDYRVSFAPAMYGQKLVIRILDTANAPTRIADLMLPAWMYHEIGTAIKQDSGMVLVAGPTGSGKTTSLYALIRSIDVTRRNVVTIEDPVEIQIESVTQIPVDEAHGKSFSELLRSVLRQDPDVLLVGEIRDSETARIAMQAAITGHLVFSTVHTKDTVGTIFRLLDLGIEPYMVAQGLHVVLAQRLIRKLCPYCKKPVNPLPEQRQAMGEIGARVQKIYQPVGCARCLGTGFSGRQAFFELLRVNDALRDVILRNPTMQEIQAVLGKGRFVTLRQSAYQLVAAGVTPFEEVDRIASRDH
ncbi:MAG TPA: ATPase, T2SS/T4P/T4SS family [Tepidisphaeraceae bacterium]|nr:ATPase, T2SS/T4P/T4SS family [Tepidisphaeraceae bacterium]